MNTAYDDIVVGAGSAGCVMAARLSEDTGRRVLLIEAGPDYPDAAALPDALRRATEPVLAGWNWDYSAQLRTGSWLEEVASSASVLANAPRDALAAARAVLQAGQAVTRSMRFPYCVGKVVGGSSAVNGALALRPLAQDFDRWVSLGNSDWSWNEVAPVLRALEADADFDTPVHGRNGPLPICRPRIEALMPGQAALLKACRKLGLPLSADLNDGAEIGVGLLPSNTVDHERVSSARAYLDPARGRTNLQVLAGSRVDRIVIEGDRAAAVEVRSTTTAARLDAARIVLCAGALNTPLVLLRSGIGAAQRCRAFGITPRVPLPGVGENLMDHPAVMLWMVPNVADYSAGATGAQHQVMARLAGRPDGRDPELNLFFLENFATRSIPMLGDMLGSATANALSVVLANPVSRGRVQLGGAAAGDAPRIELGLCTDEGEIDRLAHGVRVAWTLARSAEMAPSMRSVFMWSERIVLNDHALRNTIRRFVSATWHACGTARMGAADDPLAVTDQRGQVRGVRGLFVADASLFPCLPSVPTNVTCLMVAERVAAWLRRSA